MTTPWRPRRRQAEYTPCPVPGCRRLKTRKARRCEQCRRAQETSRKNLRGIRCPHPGCGKQLSPGAQTCRRHTNNSGGGTTVNRKQEPWTAEDQARATAAFARLDARSERRKEVVDLLKTRGFPGF